MSPKEFLKAYWKIMLLVLFVSVSLYALFVPGGLLADDTLAGDGGLEGEDEQEVGEGWTNLVYGLTLDGGTRLTAPVVGSTAEDLEIDPDDQTEIEQTLYSELDLDTADATVRYDEESGLATAEIFTDNVSDGEFAGALQEAGVDATEDDIRDGVTQTTRDDIIETISLRINEAGLSGASVSQADVGGQFFIVIEVPDMSANELRELIEQRGVVEVVAHHPDGDGGQQNDTVLVQEDFATIGTASFNDQSGDYVPVTITEERAPGFQDDMNDFGFTTTGAGQCAFEDDGAAGQNYCLLTVVDGEVVDSHSMSPDLGANMNQGTWVQDPQFQMLTPTQQDAQQLSVNLRAGALPAPLDFNSGQTFELDPALGDQFKLYSLFVGILAVLSVSGMIYLRYADARVAVPMIVTGLAEVVILLGFAAAIRMPIDLSHIAGFIAVVGTGFDDLIIIADEVMSEGDVNSRRVFQSRFRKAFWVIGVAAATTIVAMSPLAILSLGDLRGFAIITILGVLVGVLVTRPAYGDILRYLMTER